MPIQTKLKARTWFRVILATQVAGTHRIQQVASWHDLLISSRPIFQNVARKLGFDCGNRLYAFASKLVSTAQIVATLVGVKSWV